jgi:uncharacterized membrane protein
VKGHRDLELIAAGSLACAIAALLIPAAAISLIFAAPLALFATGYALVAATFARERLELPQMLTLSVAISLTVLVLGSFLLNYVPGGLGALAWAILLLVVVLNGCRVAALRRPAPGPRRTLRRPRTEPRRDAMLLGGLLLAAVALGLSQTTLPAKHARGYTELWLTPKTGSSAAKAEIGVGSEEQRETSYVLQVQLGTGEAPLRRELTLKPGETREFEFELPPNTTGATLPVAAKLFRQDHPGVVYRRVSAPISTSGAGR